MLAGCDRQPAANQPAPERAPNEKAAPKDVAKNPDPQGAAAGKPADERLDLTRDTARVRDHLIGTWYQLDHMRDGTISTLTIAKYSADGTARDEYWALDHKERTATHGTDRGRWDLRGDTIMLHFEAQPPPPPPLVVETKPSPPPATPGDLPPAAPAAAAPAAPEEPLPPRDDEQHLLEFAPDWFTYEYRPGLPANEPKAPVIPEGVSVRVGNDFKLPRSFPGYKSAGTDIEPPEPPSAAENLLKRILR